MLPLRSDATIFGKLSMQGSPSDAIRYRNQWESGLSQFELQPSGMPRRAVLIVRKIRLVPPQDRSDGWRGCAGELRTQLADQLRSAVRVRGGILSSFSGNAVLFEDDTDLVASLAADWCRREWRHRWWWHELLKTREPDTDFWLEHIQAIPEVVVRLSRAGLQRQFVEALGVSVCETLSVRLVGVFALHSVRRAMETSRSSQASRPVTDAPVVGNRATDLLVELCTLIATAPEVIRSERYAIRLALRMKSSNPGETAGAFMPLREWALESEPQPVQEKLLEVEQESQIRPPSSLAQTDEQHAEIGDEEFQSSPRPAVVEQDVPAFPVAPPGDLESPLEGTVERTRDRWFETQYGGAFCLVNVLVSLGLYADFTLTAAHELEAPFWAVLGELAKRLLGVDTLLEDPLIAAMARWTGCDVQTAFANAPPPPKWSVPDDWLPPPEGTLIAYSSGRDWSGWLDNLAVYLRPRLHAALACDTESQAITVLLLRPARVVESATALDVELSVKELPFAVRAAGLDRDPGWIPAAGKTITIHYL